MKKLFALICCLALLSGKSSAQALPVKLSIEQPNVDDSVAFSYQTTDTFKINSISLKTYVAYGKSRTKTIKFEEKDHTITGAFRVPDSANLLVLVFSDGKGGEPKGAFFPVYSSGKLARGANSNKGLMYDGVGNVIFGLQKDQVKALACYEAEVESNPEDAPIYLIPRIKVLQALGMKEKIEKLLANTESKALTNRKTPESDLYQIYDAYSYYVKDEVKAKTIAQEIVNRYPNGHMAMSKVINAFFEEKDVLRQKTLYAKLIAQFAAIIRPYTKNYLHGQRAKIALVEKDTTGFYRYANLMTDPMQKAQLYNLIA